MQKQGIKLSKENSDNLFKSAELLALNRFYSPAIPILILSAEEMIKSYALCLEILLGNDSEVKKIIKNSRLKANNSYLFNHEDKHKLAQAIIADLDSISLYVNIAKYFIKGRLRELVDFISLPTNKKGDFNKLLVEMSEFNRKKNEGLYVDNKNGAWITPMSFKEEDYLIFLNNVSMLREIFSSKIEYLITLPEVDWNLLLEIRT